MKEKQRQFAPMKCQTPDPKEMFCRDCAFRDKTEIKVGKLILKVGISKAQCDIYVYPDKKPSDVLFDSAPCDYWVKDKEVPDG